MFYETWWAQKNHTSSKYCSLEDQTENKTMATILAASSLSLNPVFSTRDSTNPVVSTRTLTTSSSENPKIILKLLKNFPEFVQKGSEVEVKLADPTSYTKLHSGVMFEDIDQGNIGAESLIISSQKVSLNYNHYAQSGCVLETRHFDGTPSKLSETFGKGFAEALRDMKPGGHRRIILPPKETGFEEYRVVDVILYSVQKPGFLRSNL